MNADMKRRFDELFKEEQALCPADPTGCAARAMKRLQSGESGGGGGLSREVSTASQDAKMTDAQSPSHAGADNINTTTSLSAGTTAAGTNAAQGSEDMRRKRLEALEARQRQQTQQNMATRVAPGNFKKRDWEKGSREVGEIRSAPHEEGLTIDEAVKKVSLEEEKRNSVSQKKVLKDGVLVAESSPSGTGSPTSNKDGNVNMAPASGGSSPANNANTGPLVRQISAESGPKASSGASPTSSNNPFAPPARKSEEEPVTPATSAFLETLLGGGGIVRFQDTETSSLPSQKPTVHIQPDLLEALSKRIGSEDAPSEKHLKDVLLGAAFRVRELEEQKMELQKQLITTHMVSSKNMQVLETMDLLLQQAHYKKEEVAEMGQRMREQSRKEEAEEKPKTFMIKRGDHTAPQTGSSTGGVHTLGGGGGIPAGAVHTLGSGAASATGESGNTAGGSSGTASAQRLYNTTGSGHALGAHQNEDEMKKHREERLARLEKQAAEKQKEREEAERKAKAREALGMGVGRSSGGH